MKEILITSSVLIVVIALVRTLFRGKIDLRYQYFLWLLVALRLLLPVSLFPSPVSILNGVADMEQVMATTRPPAAPQAPQAPAVISPPGDVETGSAVAGAVGVPPQAPTAPQAAKAPLNAPTLVRAFWLSGVVGMALWFLISDSRFRRRLRRSRKPVAGVDCPLPVYVTEAVPSPCLYGLLRPAVYVTPHCLTQGDTLRHVLAHETTHFRHGDHIWSLVRCLCLAIYWFNPLVWLAAALSRRDCELSCDEGALQALGEGERVAYGRTLLDMVVPKVSVGDFLHTATTMTSGKKELGERVALIAQKPKRVLLALAVAALIVGLAVSCTFTGAEEGGKGNTTATRERTVLTLDEGATVADWSRVGFRPEGLDEYDGRSADLTGAELPDDCNMITFDDKTKWPATLPQGFDPDRVMEANKNPGLGVRALHEKGITGKGVNLGIIDQALLLEHEEYKDNLCYYRQLDSNYEASMHGPAVASIAVGQSVGVAPDANLYYVSFKFPGADEDPMSIRPFIDALHVMLDMNDTLPQGNKLDVISISRGFNKTDEGWDEMKAALDRAEEAGIFVITVSTKLTHDMDILGASRVPMSDYDDVNQTRPGLFYAENFYQNAPYFSGSLFIPMDFRATASPTGPEDYVNYVGGGMSWAAPYFAGVYCLAKQVKADVTPQEFWRAALETADKVEFEHGATTYQLNAVIDPAGIVERLKG